MTSVPETARSTEIGRECQAILAHHAKSFRWASWFLPTRMRLDASVVYAFCRLVDDAVDNARSSTEGRRRLLEVAERLRSSSSDDGLFAAYREVAERCGFGLAPAWSLIAGAESDLGTVRMRDDSELLTYCYRVAGTVGLMMCGVLGVRSSAARARAVQLGIAMQMTNICRDVREDALLGRVYVPRSRLACADSASGTVEPESLLTSTGEERRAVCDAVLGLLSDSERVYALATDGYRHIPARPRLAVMVAARLYRAIGRRLQERGGDALRGRVVVPGWHKALLVLAALASWMAPGLLPQRPRLLLEGWPSPAKASLAPGRRPPRHASAHDWSNSLEADAPVAESS